MALNKIIIQNEIAFLKENNYLFALDKFLAGKFAPIKKIYNRLVNCRKKDRDAFFEECTGDFETEFGFAILCKGNAELNLKQ